VPALRLQVRRDDADRLLSVRPQVRGLPGPAHPEGGRLLRVLLLRLRQVSAGPASTRLLLQRYLFDLFHESATPGNGDVRRIA
jgi:hypothetical protein